MALAHTTLSRGFVTEGRLVAVPLALPDETFAIPPDESHVTCLVESPDAMRVYGTTAGAACHVFVASHRGAAGGVLDLGVVPRARTVPCLVVETPRTYGDTLLAGTNTDEGIAILRFHALFPRDTIQEPSYSVATFESVLTVPETVLHDAMRTDDGSLYCLTSQGVLLADVAQGRHRWLRQCDETVPGQKLVCVVAGTAHWFDAQGACWALDLDSGECTDTGLRISPDERVVVCGFRNTLVHADAEGVIRQLDPESCQVRQVAGLFLPHVQCMAALPDGRLYGVCGDGIGHFFRCGLRTGDTVDLGAIVSVISARRYGFEFTCAITGRDGEIYLGETDRGGHLWLYFPPVACGHHAA